MTNFDELFHELMQDSGFKQEYEKQKPEYDALLEKIKNQTKPIIKGQVKPYVTIDSMGDINVDFIHPLLRFGIILTPGKATVGWYAVSKDFEVFGNGDIELPEIV